MVAAAVGVFVGVFTLRLRGLYLAIVTLGLGFIVNHVLVTQTAWTGGLSGSPVPAHAWFGAARGGGRLGWIQEGQGSHCPIEAPGARLMTHQAPDYCALDDAPGRQSRDKCLATAPPRHSEFRYCSCIRLIARTRR